MTERKGESSYRRFLEGDMTAVSELVEIYGDSLVRFAYCYVKDSAIAEDIMEDAFALYIAKNLAFESKEQVRCWLYKTVRSRAVDYLRCHKREISLDDVSQVLSVPDVFEDMVKREQKEILYRSMQKLPQQYRVALQLHYFDEFPIEQICKIMKKSHKQVYNLLTRARTSMKELLMKEGVSYEDL